MSTYSTTPAFGGHDVRTTTINGETWFCAKDVIAALGVKATSVGSYLTQQGIAAKEARNIRINHAEIRAGRPPIFINATAVRKIAQRSTKPAARDFQNYLNGTVAEAIEKDGSYVHPVVAQQRPEQK